MAAGSQKWNGTSADLESAPTRMSRMAQVATGPVTGCVTSRASEVVPASTESITTPTSMTRPPNVVTMSACSAAPLLSLRNV